MAVDLSQLVHSKTTLKPPIVTIYGPAGIGKTTFAASAPKPVILRIEDGVAAVDCMCTPTLHAYDDVLGWLEVLLKGKHDYETVALDSLDWLEPIVWAETCKRNKWADIEQPGYGKGYAAALDYWRTVLGAIQRVRNERGMSVILVGHAQVKRYDNPETDSYDRYELKLNAKAAALCMEASDAVLFANWRVTTTKGNAKFGSERIRAIGGGDRMCFTEERPAFLAKSRYGHPEQIDLSWSAFVSQMGKRESL